MKKMKKGFTIVELVIVIGVIAILSAVLIPTFTSLTRKAKESNAREEVANAYTQYLIDTNATGLKQSEVVAEHIDGSNHRWFIYTTDGWTLQESDAAPAHKEGVIDQDNTDHVNLYEKTSA